MPIPVIREVTYTDDGCTLYECLSCYEQLEMRSGPAKRVGYDEERGTPIWELTWKCCPMCGVKLEGFMAGSREERDAMRQVVYLKQYSTAAVWVVEHAGTWALEEGLVKELNWTERSNSDRGLRATWKSKRWYEEHCSQDSNTAYRIRRITPAQSRLKALAAVEARLEDEARAA